MASIHLQPSVNGITDSQLEAIRDIADGRSVMRDEHNFWFESTATQQEIDDLCSAYNLDQIID